LKAATYYTSKPSHDMIACGHRRQALAVASAGLIAAGALSSGCERSTGGQGSVSGSDGQRADRRGDERPLLDPDVVGPRLVRESFGPQLLFWLRTYRARERGRVQRSWTAAARGTVVILRLSSKRGG
jgi:hypothetical protein